MFGFVRTSAPNKTGASRAQLISYPGGALSVAVGLVELLGVCDFPFVDDPLVVLQAGLALLGIGFVRRAQR